ncbi:biotin/lipoate--protein ligase family protein [Poseidonocella sedimentorum]|uniref:Biotin-(Acetyl-CoA carboxylase) ligase n=1 Tax=Poseidonocella sedimentorum TaxID=871652 RepID=A0A1I6D3A2_9RHOB|nr:biotin/lipoate--protein ligase family protein [Poseidonocella sedimentorum]SFQ99974.1 Biotin-(acetyl-CoA carboxylase) ligase [Poseidonocella sedimentorum]
MSQPAPQFPPLFHGHEVARGADPFAAARDAAAQGCEAGLVTYGGAAGRLEAALVLAPDVPLGEAAAMLPVAGIGFQNALGALSPPEVAVHLEWAGAIRINGARCGGLRLWSDTREAEAIPGWLVIGLTLDILPQSPDQGGEDPDRTALHAEGCGDVDPLALLEAWIRHSYLWLSRWDAGEVRAVHDQWTGLLHGLSETVTQSGRSGTFLGIDERFAMLLRDAERTHSIPLTELLEEAT